MKIEWKTCIRVGISVVVVWLVINYWNSLIRFLGFAFSAAGPLLVGATMAYVANIMMNFFEVRLFSKAKSKFMQKIRRPFCLLLAIACVCVLIAFLVNTVLPELLACVTMLVEKLPRYLQQIYKWLEREYNISEYLAAMNLTSMENIDWRTTITRAINVVWTGVGGVMGAAVSLVTGVISTLIAAFLAIVFAIYLLMGKEKLSKQLHELIRTYAGVTLEKRIFYVLSTLNDAFHSFIVVQCTEALILGSLCILGMLIFNFPYAVMIGTLVGFTALVPIAGAYFAGAVGAFMIFTIDPLKALLFLVFLVCLQQIEGNLIYPRVVGSSINLSPIWVLVGVTIGGGMLGIVGMLLGVPLAATIYQLVSRDMLARQQGLSIFDIQPSGKKHKTSGGT